MLLVDFVKYQIRSLAADAAVGVGAAGSTMYTFRTEIPRNGVLSYLRFLIYNPGKAASLLHTNEIRIMGSTLSPVKCGGIQIQKLSKFITGVSNGTQTPGASSQLDDILQPHTGQTVGANISYMSYPLHFWRYVGDAAYGLNIPKFPQNPTLEADIIMSGAALDAAPTLQVDAIYAYPDTTPAQFMRTLEYLDVPTGTGELRTKLEQITGMSYEGVMATFHVVTTADAGLHGIYGDDGKIPYWEGTFVNAKIDNKVQFNFPLAELEAVAGADTYAYYKPLIPLDSMRYNNLCFKASRGATTTAHNLSGREYYPNL